MQGQFSSFKNTSTSWRWYVSEST